MCACVADASAHGQAGILLVLEPNASWAYVLSVSALVALNAAIHGLDTRHLIWVIRFMVSSDHLGEPSLLVCLDAQGARFNLWVCDLVISRLE